MLCESKLLPDAVDDVSQSAISPSDCACFGLQIGAGVQTADESIFVGEDEPSTGVVLKMDVSDVVRLFLSIEVELAT